MYVAEAVIRRHDGQNYMLIAAAAKSVQEMRHGFAEKKIQFGLAGAANRGNEECIVDSFGLGIDARIGLERITGRNQDFMTIASALHIRNQ
ncbi:hypothetical protein HYX10_04000 [Candidatus Woesearchaeota archaeon]|nr:hypothetical protein [Candidatus Woesearchaeota archaeon]